MTVLTTGEESDSAWLVISVGLPFGGWRFWVKAMQVQTPRTRIPQSPTATERVSRGKTPLLSLPRTSPQKYLLPYRDQLSSQDILYRALLSPKSQDRFSFWPFGTFHTRPESVSCRNPRRLPSAILLSESGGGCNANCNWIAH